jgi:ABC-type amino acid transport substrate-binding protein
MKNLRLLLAALLPAALLLAASYAAGAALAPLVKVDRSATLHPFLDADAYSFHVRNTTQADETGDYAATLALLPGTSAGIAGIDPLGVLFGVLKKADKGRGWTVVDTAAGAGSFSFHAAAGVYQAFVTGLNMTGADVPYRLRVARVTPVPEPKSWALLLLGAGFVVYRTRRARRRPVFARLAARPAAGTARQASAATGPARPTDFPTGLLGPSHPEGAIP